MSTHESVQRDQSIEPGSDRSFGLTIGSILAAIGIYQFFSASPAYHWFLYSGVALIACGLALPAVLHPLNVVWTKFGLLLGRIVTPSVMFLVFTVSIVPIGLAMRLLGKDPLRLKRADDTTSYWIQRTPPGPSPELAPYSQIL